MNNIDLRPAHLPITVYYKGDVSIRFSFTSGGDVYPLASVTAASFVISEKNGTAALSLSSGSGLTINGAGGYIDMAITHAQIVTLYSQEYNYEFRLTLTGGTEWPVLDSYFTVSEDGQASVTGSDISVSLDGTSVDVSVISPAVSSGGGTWGSISGTLSDQTDLQTALDAKAATSHTHALSDITQSSATSGQVPKWNGSAWAAAADNNGIYSGSGKIQDGTTATIETGGQFSINYETGGTPALWAIDGNNIQMRSPDGGVRIQVDNSQVEIESAAGFRLTIDGSSGEAGQVPTAQGDGTTIWEDQAGGGGASITDITYADMQTAIGDSTLTPGQFYNITDAGGTDFGFICQAVKANEITVNGTGGYLNADFQGEGNYSNVEAGTGVAVGTQKGIWRTGFEAVTIPYTNLSADYVTYSTSSGVLDADETYTTDLGNTGTIIEDDGDGTVTLIPDQALVEGEVITGDNSGNTVTVETYVNPAFAIGDTITGGNTGATAVITDDDGSELMAYMTSAGVAFDGSEVLDNGNGVTADMNGAAGTPGIALGDVVIWNLQHWQLTDDTLLNGTDPETNTDAYTLLDKETYPETYVETWDISEFDFASNRIEYRQDSVGNLVRGAAGVDGFQWGNDNCNGNNIQSPDTFDIRNLIGAFSINATYPGATVSDIITGGNTTIENNIIENGGSFTGITAGANCSISRNKVGQGATLGGDMTIGDGVQLDDNTLGNDAELNGIIGAGTSFTKNTLGNSASIESVTLGPNGFFDGNTLGNAGKVSALSIVEEEFEFTQNIIDGLLIDVTATAGYVNYNIMRPNTQLNTIICETLDFTNNILLPGAIISDISADGEVSMQNNILENQSRIQSITSDGGFSISKNKLGAFSSLCGNTVSASSSVLGDGSALENLEIRANKQVVNKTLYAGVTFSDKIVQLTTDEAETYSANVEGGRTQPGFSDIPGTIDITGLTTLDITAAWAQYRGIINLTSDNATEIIDTITNPPTLFPFTLRPQGFALTITGTAYAGIGAGQIALKATDYTLDGDKGEYIVLEIDPLGTGCLVEKYVVNGLI